LLTAQPPLFRRDDLWEGRYCHSGRGESSVIWAGNPVLKGREETLPGLVVAGW